MWSACAVGCFLLGEFLIATFLVFLLRFWQRLFRQSSENNFQIEFCGFLGKRKSTGFETATRKRAKTSNTPNTTTATGETKFALMAKFKYCQGFQGSKLSHPLFCYHVVRRSISIKAIVPLSAHTIVPSERASSFCLMYKSSPHRHRTIIATLDLYLAIQRNKREILCEERSLTHQREGFNRKQSGGDNIAQQEF